ncbi:MAG TPA: helix-turn-helix domain-containing protein [Desulfuromonadaceae bacterium]|jgi:DNA-binding IclR family transcriptional regulator
MAQTYRTIDAVRKTVEILEYLASQKEPVTGSDVARSVSLPKGTVMCHLITLEETKLVRRVGDGYELGMGAALLWARKKALLEGTRERAERELSALEGGM